MITQIATGSAYATQRRFPVSGSRQIHVRNWGRSPEVILLHGFGDGAFIWNGLAQQVSVRAACAAIDLAGHGESSWNPDGRYHAESHADDVCEVLEQIGARAPVLIGHSLGAEIAVRVAARPGIGAAGVILIDGGPDLQPRGIEQIQQMFSRQRWRYASVAEYVETLVARQPLAKRPVLEEYAIAALRPCVNGDFILRCDPRLAAFAPRPESGDLWHSLLTLPCPSTIIRAAYSAVLSFATAQRMNERIAGSRLISVPSAGHAVMLDNPSAVADAVLLSLSSGLHL
jgi:pimeloyl-ACP methyl ester carboxylesterase